MKKICVVTASRSEYGLMRWIIDDIHRDEDLELQLVVTGAHLSPEQGLTYKYIEEDGYPIAEKVSMLLSCDDGNGIAKSMGVCAVSLADTFNRLQPDMLVVLGDRYELLPIAGTALVMRIPIAHIGGGDITEGAIDDEVRNAVTMMSTLHFPGTSLAAENIIRMRGTEKNIFVVGEPGLDSFRKFELWTKEETSIELGLDMDKKWCLVTLHPETRLSIEDNIKMVENLYAAMLQSEDMQYVITYANADAGGVSINNFWKSVVDLHPNAMRLFPSLGHFRYLSFMKHADMVLGNSSSGIIEAPLLGTTVINIGERQKGRHICRNIICCGRDKGAIREAIDKTANTQRVVDNYWGDGHASNKIIKQIKEYLYAI